MNEEKMKHTFNLLAELPVDVLDTQEVKPMLFGLKHRFLRSYGEGEAPGKLWLKVMVTDLAPAELEELLAAKVNNLAPCNDMNPVKPKE